MDVMFTYDEEADILYASIGDPSGALYTPIGEGVYVRLDEETREPAGFLIRAYSRFLKTGASPRVPHFENVTIPPLSEIACD